MSRKNHQALRSWIVIGIVLMAVLAVDAYQSRYGAPEGSAGDTVMISVLGRRRQAAVWTAAGDVNQGGERSQRRITAVLGAAELDLREARLRAGDQVQVAIVAVMGAITVRVPDGWTVDASAVPNLGAIRDRRLRPFDALDVTPSLDAGPAPRLVLRGAIVMGELIIKS